MNNKYLIKITGKNTTYFLKELIKRHINIYDLKQSFKEMYLIIDTKDYDKITSIKTSYKIEIVNRIGINKYLYLFKKNIIFILSFLLSLLFIIFLSTLIFEVDILHSNKDLVQIISNDLKYYGIKKYHFKTSYNNKEKIIKAILQKEKDDLEWLEIEEVGTKYIVQVEQRKKNAPTTKCVAQNIIAKKDARILEIQATSGEVVVKKNDYVKKGTVLISGLIYNKENIVSKRCATGHVYGEVWYKVIVSLPKYYQEETLTGKSNYGLEFNILGYNYNLFSNYKTAKKKRFNLIIDNLLPITISFTHFYETKVLKKNYTLTNVNQDATSLAEKRLLNQLKKEDTILTKKVLKKDQNNSKINVEVFFKVKEDITAYQDLSKINIDELNAKEEIKE